jgi:hypothetical protein
MLTTMLAAALIAASAMSAVLAAPKPAAQKECPLPDREEAVRNAPTCKQALEAMEACAYGAGGDTELGAIVVEKCEVGFLSKLSKEQRRAYDREVNRCDNKYRRQSGTMYRSFEAFCRAELAMRTEARHAKSPPRK